MSTLILLQKSAILYKENKIKQKEVVFSRWIFYISIYLISQTIIETF